MDEPPVRLCCFQRHWGAVCPDGKVMCQLCYNRFRPEDLNMLPSGQRENVCVDCAKEERRMEREYLGLDDE